jgi:transposase, IS6 family
VLAVFGSRYTVPDQLDPRLQQNRAVDSTGQTIEFLLTAKRDAAAAKRFLVKAIEASGNAMPRVMNVDKNPCLSGSLEALKAEGALPRRVRLCQCGVEV